MGNSEISLTRTGARRLGDEYQDLIALEVLLDWLEHSDRYEWVSVEADDSGFLDDVKALTNDGRFVVKQVKFATHPDSAKDPWTWETLLKTIETKRGKDRKSVV